MNGAQLILDSLERNYTNLHHELEDITLAELMAEPYPSIGWLAWHLVRVQDVQVSMLADREQAWTGDGWHAKFGMPPENVGEKRGNSAQRIQNTPELRGVRLRSREQGRGIGLIEKLGGEIFCLIDLGRVVESAGYGFEPLAPLGVEAALGFKTRRIADRAVGHAMKLAQS